MGPGVGQGPQEWHHIQTEVKASFIRDANNQPIGILGVTRDITKRKAAEDALRRREAVLEAVSYAADKFLKTHSWEKDIQEILERVHILIANIKGTIGGVHHGVSPKHLPCIWRNSAIVSTASFGNANVQPHAACSS